MKKILIALGLAAAAGSTGCTSDTTTELNTIVARGSHTICAQVVTDQTRTSLGDKGESSTPILWSSDDAIMVIDDQSTISYKYILEPGSAGKKIGSFRVESGEGAKDATAVTAFYPYGSVGGSSNNITVTIPSAQSYVAGRSFDTNLSPMYAVSSSPDDLSFHHLAGVINLQLTSLSASDTGRKVTKIEIESGGHQLSGLFNAPRTDNTYTLTSTDKTGNQKITLDCGAGVELTQTPGCFLFVVPAADYAARDLRFTITIEDSAGKVGTKTLTATNPISVARGQIVNFKATAMPNIVVVESTPEEVSKNIQEALTNIDCTTDIPTLVVNVSPCLDSQPTEVTIPNTFDTPEKQSIPVTLQLSEAPTGTMTVKADADQAPRQVAIIVPTAQSTEAAPDFTIEMPKSTVSLNGTFKSIAATTADNTLIIEKGASIGTLTVNKGSVAIYGLVGTIVKESEAGTVSRYISTTEGLAQAVQADDKADVLYFDSTPDFIDGSNATLSKPVTVTGNAKVCNLTLNISGSNAFTTGTGNLDFALRGIRMTVASPTLKAPKNGLSILHGNVKAQLIDCRIISSGKDPRGVTIANETGSGSIDLTLDHTVISTQEEFIGDRAYTQEECTYMSSQLGSSDYYPRGISVYGSKSGATTVNIVNNSAIEGFFYAINLTNNTEPRTINVENSSLDGRCAFNIWGSNAVFNTVNSKLIGRNFFKGSTELFATIVYNAGTDNHEVTVTDSEVISYNAPQTLTNYQFSADLRGTNSRLNLRGATKLIERGTAEYPARLNVMVMANDSNTVNIDPSVSVDGKPGACILAEQAWDGKTVAAPMEVSNSFEGKTYPTYLILQPSELAWFAQQLNSGAIAGSKSIELTCDIDLCGHEWTPIGASGKGFSGICFGQGYAVRNFRIPGTNAIDDNAKGLFGYTTGAKFYDITIDRATIAGSERVAALAAVTYGSTFSGCKVTDCQLTGSASVGGIVGQWSEINKGFTMKDCSVSNLQITILNNEAFADPSDQAGKKIGGLIGAAALYYTDCSLSLSNCSATGVSITSESGASVGVSDIIGQLDNIAGAANVVKLDFNKVSVANGTGYRTAVPFYKYIGTIRNPEHPYLIKEDNTQVLPAL